jgi:hypothetical protein
MIEIYVGLTLMGLGFVLNKNRPVVSNPVKQINDNELNSQTNVYDSRFVKTAGKIEKKLADESFKASNDVNGRVISKVTNVPGIHSNLAGISFPMDKFKHTNMKPFYRGTLKSIKIDGDSSKLENFTGAQQYYKPKRETDTFFKPTKDIGMNNIGSAVTTGFEQSRMEIGRVQNNTLPFQPVRVGPAINRGYGSKPEGGYQQLDERDYAMPKSSDDIRAANKPMIVNEGRIIAGQKGTVRGTVGVVENHKAPTSFVTTAANYFKTTGAFLKASLLPDEDAKYTSKQDTATKAYAGGAFMKSVGKEQRGVVMEPFKEQHGPTSLTNASLTHMPTQSKDDYGKGSIQIYDNERTLTTTSTYQGNVTSMIKALIAPIEDLVKVSRKEYTVEAPREYGQLQGTMPSKQTIYDPNVSMRTTIKETTIHDSVKFNLAGNKKQTIYDPNAVMRTTTKETLLHDSDLLNARGAPKLTVYDPNSVMRTTTKETLLHDAELMNVKGDAMHGQVYDPTSLPRTTVRQTVDPIDSERNMGKVRNVAPVYDPNNIAKTTIKETVLSEGRNGNVNRGELHTGAYTNEQFDAPQTQRQVITQDSDYSGNPNRGAGDAYVVVQDSSMPRETQKEILADKDHYGGATSMNTKSTSYEAAYNEIFDDLKEELNMGREPTQSGVKISNGAIDVNLSTRKISCDDDIPRINANANHVINNAPLQDAARSVVFTKSRNSYEEDDRIDVDILDVFKNNEFTQSLFST